MPKDTQRALIEAVHAHLAHVAHELAPKLGADPQYADPEIANIQIGQNVLRTCLEATLDSLLPYTVRTPTELAIRLASYAISAAPAEDQLALAQQHARCFPNAHERRLMQGVRLSTEWETQGRIRSNFPKGDS